MSYSPEHKLKTRERILSEAARLFREQGYAGVSIDQLMAAAGLTRGGFYAHFKSKEELLAAVIGQDYGLQKTLRRARKGELGGGIRAREVMAYYLNPANREEISHDCQMANLTADIRRVGGAASEGYTGKFRELLYELQKVCGDASQARLIAAASIGAVHLASALSDEKLARSLLRAVARQVDGVIRKSQLATA